MKRIKTINIDTTRLNTKSRKIKAINLGNNLLRLLQSDEFKNEVLSMDREYWLKGESKGSPFLKMNNEEIYNHLMQGREEWNGLIDWEIDIIIDDYNAGHWSKVVAFMNPNKPTIKVNVHFFDLNKTEFLTFNLGHEWTHTLGARHSGEFFKQSFSYFMNHALKKIWSKVMNGYEEPKTEKVCTRIWYMPWRFKCVTKVTR